MKLSGKAGLLPVLISMLLLSSCYLMPKEEEIPAPPLVKPTEVTYALFEVKKADIERKVSVTAYFAAAEQKNIFFAPSGGRLKALHTTIGEIVEEGKLLAELETGSLEIDIQIQEIVLRKAQIGYDKLKASGADSYSLEISKSDIEIAEIRLENLKRDLEKARLYAPMSGRVAYMNFDLKEGDYISPYQTIATIADTGKLLLAYSGPKYSEFKLGMEVSISVRSGKYTGTVAMTPAEAPSDAPQDKKNTIVFTTETQPQGVSAGDPATVEVLLEKREDTIVLPKQVIRNYLGRRYVIILKDGVREERDVRTGIENETETEILEGLEAGEMVIVR